MNGVIPTCTEGQEHVHDAPAPGMPTEGGCTKHQPRVAAGILHGMGTSC